MHANHTSHHHQTSPHSCERSFCTSQAHAWCFTTGEWVWSAFVLCTCRSISLISVNLSRRSMGSCSITAGRTTTGSLLANRCDAFTGLKQPPRTFHRHNIHKHRLKGCYTHSPGSPLGTASWQRASFGRLEERVFLVNMASRAAENWRGEKHTGGGGACVGSVRSDWSTRELSGVVGFVVF